MHPRLFRVRGGTDQPRCARRRLNPCGFWWTTGCLRPWRGGRGLVRAPKTSCSTGSSHRCPWWCAKPNAKNAGSRCAERTPAPHWTGASGERGVLGKRMTGRRIRRKAMAGWPVLLAVTIRLPVIRLPVATRSSFVRVRGWSADLQSAATNKGHGRPCIRGMRIRVTDILGMLARRVGRTPEALQTVAGG